MKNTFVNPMLMSDGYKQNHRIMYPKGTTLVYSNWTPRSDRHAATEKGVVVFGIQAFLNKITKEFNDNFFSLPLEDVLKSFSEGYYEYFGSMPDTKHISDLHKLGYLPVVVKSLPEGSICPIGVPMMTIYNSDPKFFWITNFLETIISTELWQPMTSATIAKGYKDILMDWSYITCDDHTHVQFQGHDFSMRGMSGLDSAMASGAGHLLSFVGTDTIPALSYLKEHYHADSSKELIGCSIPATEHSVMSMGTKDDEIGTFKRLITETYPSGLVSIVSDTWDLWKVLSDYLPKLKDDVMARDGKVVIRPDSGNPADIICGLMKSDPKDRGEFINKSATPQMKGVIELLWDIFGGTTNSCGYKVLDPHIGAIYGEAISLKMADEICDRLFEKGFASSNIVFGIGSYTYQYNTRDTYGFAMKATYGEVDGVGRDIFKDPVTDNGDKKSLVGLLRVDETKGVYTVKDKVSWDDEASGALIMRYKDGKLFNEFSLGEIRETLN